MAQGSSSNQQEKETRATTADFDHDADLSESEIDSYIVSVPDLSKKQGKQSKKKKSSKTLDTSEPSTPKRVQSNTSMSSYSSGVGLNLLTPHSIRQDRSPAKSNASLAGGEDAESLPKTPRKKVGWLGTDARVWSSRGHKSPCKGNKTWTE